MTHNPFVIGGMVELTDAIFAVALQKQAAGGITKGSKADFKLTIRRVLAEGNIAAAYILN